MTERKAGKSGANDALNVAIKKFVDNIIAERGGRINNYDIILTVVEHLNGLSKKSNEISPNMASEMYSTEIRRRKAVSKGLLSLNFFNTSQRSPLGSKCGSL